MTWSTLGRVTNETSLATIILLIAPALASASTGRYVVALEPGTRPGRTAALLREIDVTQEQRAVVALENLDAFAADLTEAEVSRAVPSCRLLPERAQSPFPLGYPGILAIGRSMLRRC